MEPYDIAVDNDYPGPEEDPDTYEFRYFNFQNLDNDYSD
jgi:hypothetical protein